MRITALKFSTFANYSLSIYFLWIRATKISKFTGLGQNTELMVGILGLVVRVMCFWAWTRKLWYFVDCNSQKINIDTVFHKSAKLQSYNSQIILKQIRKQHIIKEYYLSWHMTNNYAFLNSQSKAATWQSNFWIIILLWIYDKLRNLIIVENCAY